MNILELQEDIKDYPDKELVREMQMPSGNVPQYLVLTELTRRKRMRDEYNRQEAKDIQTVAEEVVTASGVPQGGLTAMAGALASDTNLAQDTGLAQATPMQPTRAPQQPQMMSTGGITSIANLPEQIQAGRVSLVGGARPGVGFRSGTTTNAIASLKVNFPEIYNEIKDDPLLLEEVAIAKLKRTVEPDESFSELGVRENPYAAEPFTPTASMFNMDDSGEYRGPIDRSIDSIKKTFQLETEPQSRFGKLARPFLRPSRDPEAFMYPPAQKGEYMYQGNKFFLNPDGSMISEAGIPVDDAGKAAILAANIPKVPIPNYGKPDVTLPGAIEQDFASLIADDSDGTPVEPLDIYNLPQSIIDARKMSAPELDLTKDPTILGGFDDDMAASSIVPARIDVPNNVNAKRPPAFDRYPEPVMTESPDLSGVEEQDLKNEISAYLSSSEGSRGDSPGFLEKRDLLNQGLAFENNYRTNTGFGEILSSKVGNPLHQDISDLEYAQMKLGQRERLNKMDAERTEADGVLFDGSMEDKLKYDGPMAYYLEGQATKYYQDDQYTPPEEIYSGDPREIAKYQGASDEEIQLISDRLAAEASADEAKKIAGTETRRNIEEELAAEDAAEFLALNQPAGLTKTERAQLVAEGKAKGFLNPVFDAIAERQAEREELKRLTEEADIERGGYEAAAKQEAKEQELARLEELKRLAGEATGTAGAGKASGAATDLDAEIARQLQKLDKERDTNKWLALAEAGMKMMSSTSPTLLGSIGEAGLAGTKALRTSQSGDSKDRLGLLALQQRSDASKTKGGMTSYQRQMAGKGYIAEGNKAIAAGKLAQSPEQVAEGRQLVAYGRALAGLSSLGSSGTTRTTVPAQT